MTKIVTALQTAPASGSLMVYEDLMTYRTGVYHHTRGSLQGGHAIEIVGYGGSGSSSYWIVKNSWGPRWGANGFFKIASGTNECNFESMERGYNTGVGFRKQVVNPPQPQFTTLDDLPIDETSPAGDQVEYANSTDTLVLEAAQYAATELNPVHCSGNITLYRVLSAETQLVSGMKFMLTIAVDAPTCDRGPEVYFVQVYMSAGVPAIYTLQNSYSMGTLPDFMTEEGCPYFPPNPSSSDDQQMWKTIAGVFIGISAATLVLAIVLSYRLMHSPRAPAEGTGNYHQLGTGAEHDL